MSRCIRSRHSDWSGNHRIGVTAVEILFRWKSYVCDPDFSEVVITTRSESPDGLVVIDTRRRCLISDLTDEEKLEMFEMMMNNARVNR